LETALDRTHLQLLVSAEAAGEIAAEDRAVLEADRQRWAAIVDQLLADTEEALDSVARSNRDERDQVLADLTDERDRLLAALDRARGIERDDDDVDDDDVDEYDEEDEYDADEYDADEEDDGDDADEDDDYNTRGTDDGQRSRSRSRSRRQTQPSEPVLQATWDDGMVVVWGGGASALTTTHEQLGAMLEAAGGTAVTWTPHHEVPLPTGSLAPSVGAPIGAALGWLVSLAAGHSAAPLGPSARWLAEAALWATEMVAQGRIVPSLSQVRDTKATKATAQYSIRWAAAVVDGRRLRGLVARMPGAVKALAPQTAAERVTRSVLDASIDAVCRLGASRLVAPAVPPVARSSRDVAEAVLASLDGTPFTASRKAAAKQAHELGLWTAAVHGRRRVGVLVELRAPESGDQGWLVSLFATGVERQPMRLDKALKRASGKQSKSLDAEMHRLERLFPPFSRSGDRTRVVVDNDEAWALMTDVGAMLVAAGFAVRVPTASRRRTPPRLQLWAERPPGVAKVGAQELSKVRWSVLFGDAELDAAAIVRLAAEARPLVQVKGQWVELDRSDLDAAAEVLAQHSGIQELSGAAIVRHAVGLDDNPFATPVAVAGNGWAVDVVRQATGEPPAPLDAPEGFDGQLRTYQAEARGWLAFLDRVGLGGCLAMDMGLGKTPTLLAHLLDTVSGGPVLVVAPSAVVGNWAAEAARFTPSLRVHVHHGPDRPSGRQLTKVIGASDLVVTTYATAVRDMDLLAEVEWQRLILDEAQAIKNPASDTAQQLRRLPSRSRLALTGTPVENTLGDLWSILDFTNPGLVGTRSTFIQQLSRSDSGNGHAENGDAAAPTNGNGNGKAARVAGATGEAALRALNGLLVFRRTKGEPEIAAELPDKIDELDHCGMTSEQIGLYQAILDSLLAEGGEDDRNSRKGQVLAAITALKQVCDHPAAYLAEDDGPLEGRSGKLARLEELLDGVFAAGERMLIFTHFARWGEKLAAYLSERTGVPIACYHGGLSRGVRDRIVAEFQEGKGAGALVLSIKAGGAGLNLTAANHVVLYDRWWNPAVEDQARDRAWRIGQRNTVISHRLVCPGTVDERVEEVVAGKRRIADLVLPASSSLGDLDAEQLRTALGLRPDAVLEADESNGAKQPEGTAA
jgi:SNF2 domain-containing protein/SNF2 helicase protein/helicase-like protein